MPSILLIFSVYSLIFLCYMFFWSLEQGGPHYFDLWKTYNKWQIEQCQCFFGGTHGGKRNFHIINRESKDAFQLFSLDIFLEQNLVVWSKVFLHKWQEERVENREIKFHVPRKNLRASSSWSFKVSFEALSPDWLLDWSKTSYFRYPKMKYCSLLDNKHN